MIVRQGCGCHDQNLHLSGVGEAVRPSQEAQVLAGMSQSQVHAVLLAHLRGRGAHYLPRWPPALLGAPCVPMEAEILPMPRPFLLAPLLTLAFIAARFPPRPAFSLTCSSHLLPSHSPCASLPGSPAPSPLLVLSTAKPWSLGPSPLAEPRSAWQPREQMGSSHRSLPWRSSPFHGTMATWPHDPGGTYGE